MHISIKEKLLIFIFITSIGVSNHIAQERFNHGSRVISSYIINYLILIIKAYNTRIFHEVIDAFLLLYKSNYTLPVGNNLLPATRISQSSKYTPYFDDCLGALDGTYVEMYIPIELQPRYRNRKGTLSQNILAVCNFDMRFVYILIG